jgi:hypothetical protein
MKFYRSATRAGGFLKLTRHGQHFTLAGKQYKTVEQTSTECTECAFNVFDGHCWSVSGCANYRWNVRSVRESLAGRRIIRSDLRLRRKLWEIVQTGPDIFSVLPVIVTPGHIANAETVLSLADLFTTERAARAFLRSISK